MAALAVQAMQFQMLVKAGQAEEALERGIFHALDVAKAHVVGDEREHLAGIVIGEAEAAADFGGHLSADFSMAVKADAVWRNAKRGLLTNVMQQGAQGQSFGTAGGQAIQKHERVDPDVAFRVILRRLRDALHLFDFRQHLLQKIGLVQQLKGAARTAFSKHFQDLVAHALMANLMDLRGEFTDGGEGLRFNRVAEAGGKAHGAEHAQLVFRESLMGLADGADDALLQVFASAHVVKDFARIGIKQQAVDGEVAALHVHTRVFGELDFVRMAAVRVSTVTAEGGDLDGVVGALAFCVVAAHGDKHHAELSAHGKSLRKDADDFLRRGGSGNVIVGGFAIEKQITDTAADEIGGVSVFAQSARDAGGFNRFIRGKIHVFFHRKGRKGRKE